MAEITIKGVQYKNIPNKKAGTKLANMLTQSNIKLSQTIEDYINSDSFYKLVNAIDINWNGIKIDENIILNDTSDLINWISSKASQTDKDYDLEHNSGLGKKTLQLKNNSNILTQEDFSKSNTIYIIENDFNLNGAEITLPENCVLKFNGGSLNNGTLAGDKTVITASPVPIFGNALTLTGTWSATDYLCEWFGGNLEKCINTFGGCSIIKTVTVYSPINITKYTRIILKCEKAIFVDSSFEGEYLFTATCETVPIEEGLPNPQLSFEGPGRIDLNNRTCFMKVNSAQYSAQLFLTGITVINAVNPNYAVPDISEGRKVAILWTDLCATIHNCTFAVNKRQYSFSAATPDYGVHLGASDNMVTATYLIMGGFGSIGFHNCVGNSMFDTVHVWGSPTIAFHTDFTCTFNNCYCDWSRVCYYYVFNSIPYRSISITNHHFIGPPSSEDEGYYMIKMPWDDHSVSGLVTISSISGSDNYKLLGYGDIDGETTEWYSSSIEIKGYLPALGNIDQENRSHINRVKITVPAGQIVQFITNYVSDTSFYLTLFCFEQTGKNRGTITFKNNKVYFGSKEIFDRIGYGNSGLSVYSGDNNLYLKNNTASDMTFYFNPALADVIGGRFRMTCKVVESLPDGAQWLLPAYEFEGGITGTRPTPTQYEVGRSYFDKTLSPARPIWWDGNDWVDYDETINQKIENAVNELDATKSQSAGADGLALSIEQENGKIKSLSGSIAPNTYDAYGAASTVKSEVLGSGVGNDYNTLEKIEDKLSPIETAVGDGGSIDTRISTAVGAEASRAQAAESNLQQLYENLSQSLPIPVTSLPDTGVAGKIYRRAGVSSYADYMYDENDLTTPIKMAEYSNAIDNKPEPGSDNLVKSGGVNESLSEELSTIVTAALQSEENFVINSSNWVLRKGYVNNSGVISNSYHHIHLINKNISYINLSGGTTGAVSVPYIIGKKNGTYEAVSCNLLETGDRRGNYYIEGYDELFINIFQTAESIDTITLYPKYHFDNNVDNLSAKEIYITSDNAENAISGFYCKPEMPVAQSGAKYCKVSTRGKYKAVVVGASSTSHAVYDIIKVDKTGTRTGISTGAGVFDISNAEELYLNFIGGNDRQYLLLPKDVHEVDRGLNEPYLIYNYTTSKFILSGYYSTAFSYSTNYRFIIINCKNAKTISALYGNNPAVTALWGLKINDLSITSLGGKGTYDIDEYDYIVFNAFDNTYISDVFVSYNNHVFDSVVLKPFSFNGKTALFVGDSITAGYVNGTTIDTVNAWPTLFSNHVGLTPTNRAVGGATIATVDGYSKILYQIAGANQFDFLFIAGGVNDCNLNVDYNTFRSAVDELINSILNYCEANPNLKVIWVTPIDSCLGYDSKDAFLKIQIYRNIITEEVLKNNNGRMSVVQGNKFPFPKVSDSFGYINAMFGDLLHPSALGYKSCYTVGMINALL